MPRRITSEEFDDRIKNRPIKRLDDLINGSTPIRFQCLVEGCEYIWKTAPHHILNGSGCPKLTHNGCRLSKDDVANAYASIKSVQKAADHLGCSRYMFACLMKKYGIAAIPGTRPKYSQETIIDLFIQKHGDRYSYKQVIYITTNVPIKVICHIHGIFEIPPSDHLAGRGCRRCAENKNLYTREEIIARMTAKHGGKYNYDLVVFINTYTPIDIICPIHGVFQQRPKDHLRGQTCRDCSHDKSRREVEDFINLASNVHNGKYSYDKVEYKNARTPIIIICPKHEEFEQRPNSHLLGSGCPNCNKQISKPETEWLDYLNIPKEQRQIKLAIDYGKKKYIKTDAYDPITNTIYEFYGDYWHGNPNVFDLKDTNYMTHKTFGELYENTMKKEEAIIKAGYKLITIWENDWNALKKELKYG
jgi:hypothetical protein